jgi:hypothetical protein
MHSRIHPSIHEAASAFQPFYPLIAVSEVVSEKMGGTSGALYSWVSLSPPFATDRADRKRAAFSFLSSLRPFLVTVSALPLSKTGPAQSPLPWDSCTRICERDLHLVRSLIRSLRLPMHILRTRRTCEVRRWLRRRETSKPASEEARTSRLVC